MYSHWLMWKYNVICALGWSSSPDAPWLCALPSSQHQGGRREAVSTVNQSLPFIQLLHRVHIWLSPTASSLCPRPICALRTQSWFWRTGELLLASSRLRSQQGKVTAARTDRPSPPRFSSSPFSSSLRGSSRSSGAMSRKKAVKGKGGAKSPKASPSSSGGRTGKGLAAAAAPSSGLVYPSRPSISNSGEFYDIAFKVRFWRTGFQHVHRLRSLLLRGQNL